MTHGCSSFSQARQHDDYNSPLFPNKLPEIRCGMWKRSLGGDVSRISWIVIGYCRSVDVIRTGGVRQFIQHNPGMIVGHNIRITILLDVFFFQSYGCLARFSYVSAKCYPFLFQTIFVAQVIFHVTQDHVAGGYVHVVEGRLFAPGRGARSTRRTLLRLSRQGSYPSVYRFSGLLALGSHPGSAQVLIIFTGFRVGSCEAVEFFARCHVFSYDQ